MAVLVTGGSGFIGRNLVRNLLSQGSEVVVADLIEFPDNDVKTVKGDLRDPKVAYDALSNASEGIVHLAALTRVLASIKEPMAYYETNVGITQNLLEGARNFSIPKFVFASTNAVVGDMGEALINENMKLSPLTPYGATKAASEMLISAYSSAYGIDCSILRFTNVYGTDMESKDSLVARLMKAAVSGATIEIYGSGSQVRDYVFLDDVVEAIKLGFDITGLETVVVGYGKSTSVVDLIDFARKATRCEIPTIHVDAKPGEMPAVKVDNRKLFELGGMPKTDLQAGLDIVWKWWLENR
ncbi:MAG: NAD-dependent epimerase/dehydratase family protein [Acidimicrobiales bacterium]|nr:NAD-dependent epimerase/dehydratase family protein [Acidimicrobiales bacterium]